MIKVYGSLNLQGPSAYPNGKRIQRAANGQVIVLTKLTIYVLTPDLGISLDPSLLSSTKGGNGILKWYKGELPISRNPRRFWTQETPHWGAVAPGAVDLFWKDFTISPLEIGCLIATLDSNAELSIWSQTKEQLAGEWQEIQNVTGHLYDSAPTEEDSVPSDMRLKSVLRSQVTAIDWSPQILPTEDPEPPCMDASLLVAGTRAGYVEFFRYNEDKRVVELIHSYQLSDGWITQISWSRWTITALREYTAFLACALDHKVVILTVKRCWEEDHLILDVSVNEENWEHTGSDRRIITTLAWLDVGDNSNVLIYTKPQSVHLWAPPSSHLSIVKWSGTRILPIFVQRTSLGTSPSSPASGFVYIADEDSLVFSLLDGTAHVIRQVSTEPIPTYYNWAQMDVESTLYSESLSKSIREVFVSNEARDVSFNETGQVVGFASFGQSGICCWLTESWSPFDLDFNSTAERSCVLVTGNLLGQTGSLGWQLPEILVNSRPAMLNDSLYTLGPFLLSLVENDGAISHPVNETQSSQPVGLSSLLSSLPLNGEEAEEKTQLTNLITNRFKVSLYRLNTLSRLRLHYSLAILLSSTVQDPTTRSRLQNNANELLNSIQVHIVACILKYLILTSSLLQGIDILLLKHIRHFCDDPSVNPELKALSRQLANQNSQGLSFKEICPACAADIPWDGPSVATCSNGHKWPRCSATLLIISTPFTRNCVCCTRKYLVSNQTLQLEEVEEKHPAGLLTEALLRAISSCLYCGCRLIRIL